MRGPDDEIQPMLRDEDILSHDSGEVEQFMKFVGMICINGARCEISV